MAESDYQQLLAAVNTAAAHYGIPPAVLMAVASVETGGTFNLKDVGDKGTSFGPFQDHEGGELDDATLKGSVANAENPQLAALNAAQTIAAAAKAHPDETWGQIAAAAQRPADKAQYASDVDQLLGTSNQPSSESSKVLGSAVPASISGKNEPASQNSDPTGTTPTEVQGYLSPPELKAFNTPYNGPGAYKGFDLSAISPQLQSTVKSAIDTYLADPAQTSSIESNIENTYGAEAWAMSDPQIRTLLVVGTLLDWDKDPNLFTDQLNRTDWYTKQSDNARSYEQLAANNPGQAQAAVSQASARVTDMANELGVQLTQTQVAHIAQTVAQQSVDESGAYSATAFSDQQLAAAVSAEFNATTFANSMSNTPAPAASDSAVTATTGAAGGDAASLYNAFQQIAKDYYLPMTSQQIAQQVQKYIQSYTGQGDFTSGATAGFTTYAKQMATNLYPALNSVLGMTGANGTTQTPYSALAGYRTLIANYTGYNGDPDTIDLSSPQWSWILTGAAVPGSASAAAGATSSTSSSSANSTPSLPSYDAVQKYLMQQPAFQSTDMAKSMGWQVGNAILKSFGYVS